MGGQFKIEHVFSGDPSLVGQFMFKSTMDEMPRGSSNPIVPRLKKGDVGIFAIQRLSNGVLAPPLYGYPFPDGPLPLIKGRHAGYEKAMERLTGKAYDEGSESTPSTSPAPEPTAPGGAATKGSPQMTPTASESASAFSRTWIIGGIVMLVLAALYLVFRPKRR